MPRLPRFRPPTPPGEVLLHDFLEPLGLTQRAVAEALGVPYQRLNEVVRGRRTLSVSTGLRLARYFGTSPDFWINLQAACDLYEAREQERDVLGRIVPLAA